ncbi:competence/damage-inducible protein A [Granulicatella seriolae]|uniref:Putative competence-damage inducible protein n=1 Tax=Granulicatella seriolae TaxID=2967226 RepID=A0ABT1WK27_9LACT|nr:competence/damage-inducible protein A [Granulicatella seriolae]
MNVEIIAVGTELLMGQIINTNSAYLAKELASLSLTSYYQQVVGDNMARLIDAIDLASSRADIIILTGGLGPTTDDITKQALATYLGEELVEDKSALDKIIAYHVQSHRDMPENNRRQALTFKNGQVLANHNGLAIGSYLVKDSKSYLVLPGPPSELRLMFEEEARPLLENEFGQTIQFESRYLRFFGIGESKLVTVLAPLIDQQTNPTIAPYAGKYEVVLRLTANGKSKEECIVLLDNLEEKIMADVREYFYGYGEHGSLVEEVAKLLEETNETISVAESLTGGLFQASLVEQSGISSVFKGGIVSYQRSAKESVLQVPKDLLDEFGMVSKECAHAMAENVRKLFDSDIAISFTGVAGPEPLEGKEVGTVFIGIVDRQTSANFEFHFARNRNGNREFAVQQGLDVLRRWLLSRRR